MFVSKKHHLMEITRLERELELSKSYWERACRLQEDRIKDLQQLVFIPKTDISPETYEIDNVMSVSEKPFSMSEEEQARMLAASREMDLLISGNYDEDLIN